MKHAHTVKYFLVPLFLVGCTAVRADDLDDLQRQTQAAFTYQNYAAYDYRAADTGNCAVYAETIRDKLRALGHKAYIVGYTLPDGTGHAVTISGGRVFDVRFAYTYPQQEAFDADR